MSIIHTVAELGEGPGDPPPTLLFWVKNEEITDEGKAGRANKTKLPPPPPVMNMLMLLIWLNPVDTVPQERQVRVELVGGGGKGRGDLFSQS